MKNYKDRIEAIEQMEDVIKMNIINDIKEYMKEHNMSRFENWFHEEDSRVKEEDLEEFNDLYDDIVDDFMYLNFTYWTKRTNEAQTDALYLDENGELMMESTLACVEGDYYDTIGDPVSFNEEQMIAYIEPRTLNKILLNIQNEKFHRMNELLAE